MSKKKILGISGMLLLALLLNYYIIFQYEPGMLGTSVYNLVMKLVMCVAIDFIVFIAIKKIEVLKEIPIEIFKERDMIWNLAQNDFKTKFAGSYLGTFWAVVQPIVTVLLYWFVFEKGLKAGDIGNQAGVQVPFVLWLMAGLVPWFFFQDALNGATMALIEYNYLVKKVVFKISILPIIKILSAMFFHLFFVGFMLIMHIVLGCAPGIYGIQIIYYSVCVFALALSISYLTCAIVLFFRDLSQIISIVLQVGTWMTPIMWNFSTMDLPPVLKGIFRLNPMFYVVEGYRQALIYDKWFWEEPGMTIYFWIIVIGLFGIGALVFKKLKVHFADVL